MIKKFSDIEQIEHFTGFGLYDKNYYDGSSKRDYFGKSNYGQIVFKVSYLFDITRTKNVKRK